jgi:chromosomal replication initiation ATPase DnaA
VPDQLLLGVRLRDSSVFASYFAGRNRAIVDVLKALQPGALPTCVFIQGAAASGKSHLLQAVSVDATRRGLSAAYLPLREIRSIGPEMLTLRRHALGISRCSRFINNWKSDAHGWLLRAGWHPPHYR